MAPQLQLNQGPQDALRYYNTLTTLLATCALPTSRYYRFPWLSTDDVSIRNCEIVVRMKPWSDFLALGSTATKTSVM